MNDNIIFLQKWYESRCNGTWEHSYGLSISNIDNPGWKLSITGETLKKPNKISEDRSEADWISIIATDTEFKGYGAPRNLEEIIAQARNWLEQ